MRRILAPILMCLLAGASASCQSAADRPRVLLIGLDGLSWDSLDAMMKAGEAPHFNRLRESGATGVVEGEGPTTPAAFWVTAATGRAVAAHRVDGPIRFDAGAGALVAPERVASTIWEIVARARMPVGVLNWPGSAPPPPGLALRLDDFAFYRGLGLAVDLAGESLTPPPYEARNDFVGRLPRGGEFSARLAAASRTLLPALAAQHWPKLRLLAVFFDGLNSARHYAGAAVALGEASHGPEFGKMSRRYVREVDNALGELLRLADRQTLVMVVSDDSSFAPGATPQGDFAHSAHGLIALAGPEIAAGRRLEKCSPLDLAPLALAHLGLSLSEQMPGKPFPTAWKNAPPAFAKVASHDAYVRRPYPPEPSTLPPEAQRRLSALRKAAHAGEGSFTERNIYALELLSDGKTQGALTEARRDLAEHANNPVSLYLIGETRLAQGKLEEAKRNYEAAARGLTEPPAGPAERELRAAVGLALARAALILNDLPTAVASLRPALEACDGCLEAATLTAQCALRAARPDEAAAVVEPALKTHPREATLWLLLGQARRDLGDGPGARAAYVAAVRNAVSPPVEVLRELGRLEAAEGRWSDALKHLGRVAELAPNDAEAWRQIALARTQRGQTAKAEAALVACLRADADRVDAWREWRKIAGADGREELYMRLAAAARAAIANRLVEGE